MAQLHDALVRLHVAPEPSARSLAARLRELIDEEPDAEPVLELDAEAARQVQLAVYADQSARKPVSPALAEAREQAFRFLESQS